MNLWANVRRCTLRPGVAWQPSPTQTPPFWRQAAAALLSGDAPRLSLIKECVRPDGRGTGPLRVDMSCVWRHQRSAARPLPGLPGPLPAPRRGRSAPHRPRPTELFDPRLLTAHRPPGTTESLRPLPTESLRSLPTESLRSLAVLADLSDLSSANLCSSP